MDFNTAINNLILGKKIRRDCWQDKNCWQLINEQLVNSIHEHPNINKSQLEATDWSILEEDKKVKCIYCNQDIHIDNWAGVNKKGMFCKNISCLMQLAKEAK
jgi:hypothetical protein